MRDCLDAAFAPAGQKPGEAPRLPPPVALALEPALTELSFGSSIPACVAEQRCETREQLSVYRVAALRWQAGEALCLIRNISSGGLMGKLAADLEPGDAVRVEIRSGLPIAAHVVWRNEELVGLSFDAPINVLDVLHASVAGAPGLTQRMPRIRVSCPVGLALADMRQQVTLADISQGGVKLCTEMCREGEEVQVSIQGLDPRRGVVRWAHAGYAGIAFLDAIPFDMLAHWAAERQVEY